MIPDYVNCRLESSFEDSDLIVGDTLVCHNALHSRNIEKYDVVIVVDQDDEQIVFLHRSGLIHWKRWTFCDLHWIFQRVVNTSWDAS